MECLCSDCTDKGPGAHNLGHAYCSSNQNKGPDHSPTTARMLASVVRPYKAQQQPVGPRVPSRFMRQQFNSQQTSLM